MMSSPYHTLRKYKSIVHYSTLSNWRFSCSLSGHSPPPQLWWLLSLEWLSYFKHLVWSLLITCLFGIHSPSHTKITYHSKLGVQLRLVAELGMPTLLGEFVRVRNGMQSMACQIPPTTTSSLGVRASKSWQELGFQALHISRNYRMAPIASNYDVHWIKLGLLSELLRVRNGMQSKAYQNPPNTSNYNFKLRVSYRLLEGEKLPSILVS